MRLTTVSICSLMPSPLHPSARKKTGLERLAHVAPCVSRPLLGNCGEIPATLIVSFIQEESNTASSPPRRSPARRPFAQEAPKRGLFSLVAPFVNSSTPSRRAPTWTFSDVSTRVGSRNRIGLPNSRAIPISASHTRALAVSVQHQHHHFVACVRPREDCVANPQKRYGRTTGIVNALLADGRVGLCVQRHKIDHSMLPAYRPNAKKRPREDAAPHDPFWFQCRQCLPAA
jgi:hypothetical protein